MLWPSGARWWSCPSRADPRGSWNAGGRIRTPGVAACPGRAGAPGQRPRRATSAAERRRAARPAARYRKGPPSRLLFAEDVGTLGRIELELGRVDLGIALELGEAQHGGLAEVVGELHRLEALGIEAHAHALEAGLALARRRFQPLEPVFLAGIGKRERFLHAGAPGGRAADRSGGRGADRRRELAHGHLVQLAVVEPHAGAVPDDHLVG